MKAWFVVVDEYRSRDVHGVDQAKAFADTTLANEFLNLWRDVNESASARYFKPEMLGERFHLDI